MSEPLDPLSLPLQGTRLIEASAGTGKTWTMAALYLRFVLGHGRAAPLLPGQVLVMTFTKAATRELASRIRERLVQAAAVFRGLEAPKPADRFLHGLLAAYPEGPEREQAAWRLAGAAEAMDEAAVFTIDAWCQRMLREHAFDSGCLFDEELQANLGELRRQAVQDVWRQQVAPLHGAVLDEVLGLWPDVAALLKEARALGEQALPGGVEEGGLGALAERLFMEQARTLAALKAGWVERAQAMLDWLTPLWADKTKPIDGTVLGEKNAQRWLQALADWAADPAALKPDMKAGAGKFTPQAVLAAFRPGRERELPAVFAEFEALMQALAALPKPQPALRARAVALVNERMQQLKAQAGTFGFQDMLQRLDDALDEGRQGERAGRLRARILQQYPVAMVDEFQDTSPRQLSIFNRLYRIAANEAAHTLLLIGDPKQSIYAFRGADIHSYLRARRATAGRHHALGTNYRSTPALVAAVNACFNAAEQRAGAGAFMYRSGEVNDLPFEPVAAQGREETFVCSGAAPPALQWHLSTELRSQTRALAPLAAACAERIVQRLNDPGCGFERPDEPFERLRPADVAVLVRNGAQAREVQLALRRRGVASVYLSDQDSVFATPEAADLLRLLQAVAAPRELRTVRAALATALMGLPLAELLALAQDDEAFDARCEVFVQLQRLWQAQGVLAMLRRALHQFGLPARWLAQEGEGERRLTNVLHLAELLQARSEEVEGQAPLLRWLAQRVDEATGPQPDGAGDDAVLRLESDADRVQVATLHKSKGLEYPLVFLPFAAHFRPVAAKDGFVRLPPGEQGEAAVSLAPSPEELDAADHDRLREDLRLLYVGFTRARHALWVGVAALQLGHAKACVWHRSAVGHLVSGPEPREAQALAADLEALVQACPGQGLERAAENPPNTALQAREPEAPLGPARVFNAEVDRHWAIHSYSGLLRSAGNAPQLAAPATGELPRLWRDDEPAAAEPAQTGAQAPWHRFPRGALAGNFLHNQLEWLAGEGFALPGNAGLQQALLKRCERQGWGHRASDVLAWMTALCERPVPALGSALQALPRTLPEMEFWFPSSGVNARALDDLCKQHLLPGQLRPELAERDLQGLLMGFADLVFEQDGRYGVLDHKSNALGPGDAAYTQEAMAQAMLQHRYDVQAALYLLALHRLLRARLGAAYAPQRQLHGAVYLFLRGVNSPSGGGFLLPPPLALLDELDALLPQAQALA